MGMCLMIGVYVVGVHLTGVYFTGVHLMGLYLINAHLTGAYLIGVHLVGVYLTDVHLMSAYLINVHLTGMHLIGAHLTGVHLMRVSRGEIRERGQGALRAYPLGRRSGRGCCTLEGQGMGYGTRPHDWKLDELGSMRTLQPSGHATLGLGHARSMTKPFHQNSPTVGDKSLLTLG
jgi:hypothetical protein